MVFFVTGLNLVLQQPSPDALTEEVKTVRPLKHSFFTPNINRCSNFETIFNLEIFCTGLGLLRALIATRLVDPTVHLTSNKITKEK